MFFCSSKGFSDRVQLLKKHVRREKDTVDSKHFSPPNFSVGLFVVENGALRIFRFLHPPKKPKDLEDRIRASWR